jgi:single-strand DNA-binding protein
MSSRSLNKVLLIGNLTRDPELRYTPQGTPVCTFGLATNRSWQPSVGGERQEETEFHRIVAWNKLAELCSELLFKGRKTFVEGRLQTRNWTDAQGQERTTVEIVIDNMIVLDSKRKDGQEGGGEYQQQPEYVDQGTEAQSEPVANEQPAEVEPEAPKDSPVKKESSKTEDKVNPDDIPF